MTLLCIFTTLYQICSFIDSRSNKDILYLSQLKNEYNSEKTQKEQFLRDRSSKLKIAIENYNNEIEIIENRLHELNDEIKDIKDNQKQLQTCLDVLKTQRPSFLLIRKAKKLEYDSRLKEISDQIVQSCGEERDCRKEIKEYQKKLNKIKEDKNNAVLQEKSLNNEIDIWIYSYESKISRDRDGAA